jgi:hypothetical protein
VGTGSREENALFNKIDASFRSNRIGKRFAAFSSEVGTGSHEEDALF